MSEPNIFMIGLIASVIVWIVKQLAARGRSVPSAVLTVGVYAISLVLAIVSSDVQFPSFPSYAGDPVAFASSLLAFANGVFAIVGGYVAFAALAYQSFVKRLLENGIPLGVQKVRAILAG